MSRFKISNQIFSLGLDAQEISIYTYLCSLPSLQDTLDGESTVHVKQATIAQNCGIKAAQTVSKVISRLTEKGLVEPLRRSVKANHHKGTYIYIVKKQPTISSYFFVDRHIWGRLIPRQMMIYLFICKCFSPTLHDSWNSYNDIAHQTGMKREMVIQTINELTKMRLIVRCKRKSRTNRKVYVDNHYQVVFFIRGRIRKKVRKKVRLYCEYNHTDRQLLNSYYVQYNNSTVLRKSQEIAQHFFQCRGSP